MNTVYAAMLAQTSAMRMQAPRLRVSGDDGPVQAAILLHEVERTEARALEALGPEVSDVTRFRSAVERCGLLIEARDASAVLHERWPEVWACAESCPSEVVESALARLRPAVAALRAEQLALVTRYPLLRNVPWAVLGRSEEELARAAASVAQYVLVFPGDWNAWQHLAVVADVRSRAAEAWRAIGIARRLDPEDDVGWALEVSIATSSMAPDELRAWLDQTAAVHHRGRGGTDVSLALAGGYAVLARKRLGEGPTAERDELLARTQAAITHGQALLTPFHPASSRRQLRAMQIILNELRAGREPTSAVLERAGVWPPPAESGAQGADPLVALRRPAVFRGLAA